jgi:predicted nucleic acid-binding protein
VAGLTVIFDACVLYPAPLRDLLMQLALSDLITAKWTDRIHDEWIENLLKNRPDLTRTQLERTRQLMNRATRDAIVQGHESLIQSVHLPDENDKHVLAAAIHAKAQIIVSFNLRDFPSESLQPYKIEALHPDDLIMRLIALDAPGVLEAVRLHRARLRHPPKSAEEYLRTLEAQGLIKTVLHLKDHIASI